MYNIYIYFILSLAPKGCKEVCTAGAAAERGSGAEEAEEYSGITVHFGPTRWWFGAPGSETRGWRLTTADGCRPRSFWWVLQVSWARPWTKHEVCSCTTVWMKHQVHYTTGPSSITIYTPSCRLTDKYEEASVHLWDLLEGRDKAVVGTTCKRDCKHIWLATSFS